MTASPGELAPATGPPERGEIVVRLRPLPLSVPVRARLRLLLKLAKRLCELEYVAVSWPQDDASEVQQP